MVSEADEGGRTGHGGEPQQLRPPAGSPLGADHGGGGDGDHEGPTTTGHPGQCADVAGGQRSLPEHRQVAGSDDPRRDRRRPGQPEPGGREAGSRDQRDGRDDEHVWHAGAQRPGGDDRGSEHRRDRERDDPRVEPGDKGEHGREQRPGGSEIASVVERPESGQIERVRGRGVGDCKADGEHGGGGRAGPQQALGQGEGGGPGTHRDGGQNPDLGSDADHRPGDGEKHGGGDEHEQHARPEQQLLTAPAGAGRRTHGRTRPDRKLRTQPGQQGAAFGGERRELLIDLPQPGGVGAGQRKRATRALHDAGDQRARAPRAARLERHGTPPSRRPATCSHPPRGAPEAVVSG